MSLLLPQTGLFGAGERRQHVGRAADEAVALLHVPDRRLRAEVRRSGSAAVLQHDAAVPEEIRIGERAKHALVGVYPGEQYGADAEILQDAVERRVPEAADAIFIDLNVP